MQTARNNMREIYIDFKITDLEEKPYRNGITTTYFDTLDLDEIIEITLSEIMICKGSEQDINVFVMGVRYCAFRFILFSKGNDKLIISNEEIENTLHIDRLSSLRFRYLIGMQGLASPAHVNNSKNEWNMILHKKISDYEHIKSITDYFEKNTEYRGSYKRRTLIDPAPIIEKVAHTDPTNIQATTANLMQIDNSYYINALQQSQRSFN